MVSKCKQSCLVIAALVVLLGNSAFCQQPEVVVNSLARPDDPIVGIIMLSNEIKLNQVLLITHTGGAETGVRTLAVREKGTFVIDGKDVTEGTQLSIIALAVHDDKQVEGRATVLVRDPDRAVVNTHKASVSAILELHDPQPDDVALINEFVAQLTEGENNVATVDTDFNPGPGEGPGTREAAAAAISLLLSEGVGSPDQFIRRARSKALEAISDVSMPEFRLEEHPDRAEVWTDFFDFVDQKARQEFSADTDSIISYYNNLVVALRDPQLTDQSIVEDAIEKRLGRVAKELVDLNLHHTLGAPRSPKIRHHHHHRHRLFR